MLIFGCDDSSIGYCSYGGLKHGIVMSLLEGEVCEPIVIIATSRTFVICGGLSAVLEV